MHKRPIALITGVGRKNCLGFAIAQLLAEDGWDIAVTYWSPYDDFMSWGKDSEAIGELEKNVITAGGRFYSIEADLSDPETPAKIFDSVMDNLGPLTALILSHCYSVDSDILNTTIERFDRHFAINTRASWLLVKEFGLRYSGEKGRGRIIALTSDHTAGNLPYGASKGALDRIVLASAKEFRDLGIRANVINPGAIDTGWMDEPIRKTISDITLGGRLGKPADVANYVRFLCSQEGGWVNGQLLFSNGGIA